MTIKHNKVTAIVNDPTKDVSANAWNDDHAIAISIVMPGQASDPPSAVFGEFWYNSTTGRMTLKDGTGNVQINPLQAANTIKGNNTGASATTLDLTAAQVAAMLPVFTSALKGLAPASGGGTANFLRADGSWQAPAGTAGISALTGDVTATGPGSVAATIAAGAVSLSKMANLTASTILGNNTGVGATPLALTPAQVKTLLAISTGDVSGLAAVASSGLFSALLGIPTTLAGYGITDAMGLTGNQTAAGNKTFSGNVNVLAGNLRIQDPTDTTKVGNFDASQITTATTRTYTLPDIAGSGLVVDKGTQSIAGSKTFTNLMQADITDPTKKLKFDMSGITAGTTRTMTVPDANGTLMLTSTTTLAAQEPAHTGDVTNPAGSLALTIAANVVTNAKAAQMATQTLKGNNTGSTANAADLTATQVTAMLNPFTSALQGLAPASGGGTSNFLRADGTWALPSAATAPTLGKIVARQQGLGAY